MKLFLLLVLGYFCIGSANASLELVQSVPVETNLLVPGIPETQSVWLDLIRSAKKTIDLEQFYVSSNPGSALEPVLAELKNAANRGVKIRMLLDAKFYATYPNDANALAKNPNVMLKTIDFAKLNGVMHAKYLVVDQTQAYSGSANFDWLALSHIHEIGLKINDPVIAADLEKVFEHDWGSGVLRNESVTAPSTLGFFASPPAENPAGISPTLDALVKLIGSAKKSLQVQMYDYSTRLYQSSATFKILDQAIRAAAARGVQVELLFDKNVMKSGKSDVKALSELKNVQVKLVTIPQWSGGPLSYARLVHSKYSIVDQQTAWIGSENWSGGYFSSCRNVGLIFNDAKPVQDLVKVFTTLWQSQYSAAL